MTKPLIPIINMEGKKVADFVWTGGLVKGSGEIVSTSKKIKKRIEEAIVSDSDIKNVMFRSASKETPFVYGLQGFEGYWNALELILKKIGLRMDDENIIWPSNSEFDYDAFSEDNGAIQG